MNYYEVAPMVIVRTDAYVLTYSSEMTLSAGSLVEIPVGKKSNIGVVMKHVSAPDFEVRPISRALELPALPVELLATAHWMSDYYATHIASVLQTLLPRGLTKKRRKTTHTPLTIARKRTNFVLTKDQQKALNSLSKSPSGTALLHGVTGSGKTAVYIEQAKRTLAAGKSVIVLVPEIALTSQLLAEFTNHFDDILLSHSQQTEAQRHAVWLEALTSTKPRVAVGPRSALFLPLNNLGLIVIDECHEPAYKQEQAPRYSALRTANILAKHHGGLLLLGSATPSVVDYYLAQVTNSPILTLPTPAAASTKPSLQVIDMTKRSGFTRHRFLSDALLAATEKTLANGEQALIFHNRRGTSSTTLCEQCGWQAGCARCYIPLTLHADHHNLRCHICGSTSRVPTSCPECGQADIIHKGIGTKLIESEIKKLFPKARIARFDGDTTHELTADKRYQELYDGDIDIIIGTQVIAKGLDLPHLRSVGVVQADAGLSLPDYSSAERTFQLLAQVIGRVGRSSHATTVIVQSYQPNHPAVVDGIAQNYQDFYERTLKLRRHTTFPPFCYLLKLTCTYKTEATAIKNARTLANTLRQSVSDIEILGPTPAFYERVRDSYRWQIVIKSPKRAQLIDCLAHIPPGRHWQSELDPVSLL